MDKNKKDKVAINDDLLDKVAGGFSGNFGDPTCPYCGGFSTMEFIDTDPTGRISYYRCGICGYEQSEYNG